LRSQSGHDFEKSRKRSWIILLDSVRAWTRSARIIQDLFLDFFKVMVQIENARNHPAKTRYVSDVGAYGTAKPYEFLHCFQNPRPDR